ncbi:MAG: hypothetical protein ACTHU0_34770 [Kofleriaceae bacterium]
MLKDWAKNKRLESYVVTAIPVGDLLYVGFNVVSSDDVFVGSVVASIERSTLSATIVYESDTPMIDHVVQGDGWQCVLMETCIVELRPGAKPIVTKKKLPTGLYRMVGIGKHCVGICGDNGQVLTYEATKLKTVPAVTGPRSEGVADLRAIGFDGSRMYVVGDYGTFSAGTTKLVPCWGKENPFTVSGGRSTVFSVYASKDEILLGGDYGLVAAYPKGSTSWKHLTGLPADVKVFAMAELKGHLFVSTEEFGFYRRSGTKLKRQKGEAGGYRMEANGDVLASSCGSFVYLFDGKTWTRLRLHPNPKKLVEKLPLDF